MINHAFLQTKVHLRKFDVSLCASLINPTNCNLGAHEKNELPTAYVWQKNMNSNDAFEHFSSLDTRQ